MRVVGKALAGLDPKTHNAMVAALSKRAAPYERWGPNLSPYPDVVRARIDALQTGDLVLCSSGPAMSWVGNAIQVITDSTWNHVAMVVRGHMTFEEENDQAPHGDDIARHSDVKRFAKHRDRTPYHFHVEVHACAEIKYLHYPNSLLDFHAGRRGHVRHAAPAGGVGRGRAHLP